MSVNADGTVVTVGSFDGVHAASGRADGSPGGATGADRWHLRAHPMEVINLRHPLVRLQSNARCWPNRRWTRRSSGSISGSEAGPERLSGRSCWAVRGSGLGSGGPRVGEAARVRGRAASSDRLGFSVGGPAGADLDGGAISSTRVRRAVVAGDLDAAARMLGRPYRMTASVVRGAGRGRTIGVPTANLRVPARKQLPPDGVYAVRVEWAGGRADGMLNQGPRPTVGDPERTVEVNLFDVVPDLYGSEVRVEWVDRLRDIRRFDSIEALGRQLAEDRRLAKARLAAE
jgi:hypothetical protein